MKNLQCKCDAWCILVFQNTKWETFLYWINTYQRDTNMRNICFELTLLWNRHSFVFYIYIEQWKLDASFCKMKAISPLYQNPKWELTIYTIYILTVFTA